MDVSKKGDEIGITFHRLTLEPVLKKVAYTFVLQIIELGICSSDTFDERGDVIRFFFNQQMYMIGHHAIGEELTS